MVLAAAIVDTRAIAPLAIIGGGWLVAGLLAIAMDRHVVREISLNDNVLCLASAAKRIEIDASNVTQIGYSRRDLARAETLKIKVSGMGTIKASPRLNGLADLLLELRRLNPGLQVQNVTSGIELPLGLPTDRR